MSDQYILDDDGEPQVCEDLFEWGRWMATADRIVLQTHIGDVFISTVFLGLDYNHFGGGADPVLWETMIFAGRFDMFQWRYRRKLDAMRGHIRALAMVELTDAAPRRLKKAMRKAAAGSFYDLQPHERRHVEQAVTRAMRRMEAVA